MRAMKPATPLLFMIALGCADGGASESAPTGSSDPVRLHYYSIGPN